MFIIISSSSSIRIIDDDDDDDYHYYYYYYCYDYYYYYCCYCEAGLAADAGGADSSVAGAVEAWVLLHLPYEWPSGRSGDGLSEHRRHLAAYRAALQEFV